jgi:hypothetical protein
MAFVIVVVVVVTFVVVAVTFFVVHADAGLCVLLCRFCFLLMYQI